MELQKIDPSNVFGYEMSLDPAFFAHIHSRSPIRETYEVPVRVGSRLPVEFLLLSFSILGFAVDITLSRGSCLTMHAKQMGNLRGTCFIEKRWLPG